MNEYPCSCGLPGVIMVKINHRLRPKCMTCYTKIRRRREKKKSENQNLTQYIGGSDSPRFG